MAKALTDIRHGKDDGSVVEFKQGDDVTGLDAETVEALEEIGAIGSDEDLEAATAPPRKADYELVEARERIEELEARVAELEAELEASNP